MTETRVMPMDGKAFRALVDTYGASPERWPQAVRHAAMAFAETGEGRALTAAAARMDAALLSFEATSPSGPLTARILADGDTWLARRRRLRRFAISAGLIGVGLAGGLTGAAAVTIITPPPVLSINGTMTAFGELQYEGEFLQEKR